MKIMLNKTTNDLRHIYISRTSSDNAKYQWDANGKFYEYNFSSASPDTNITLTYTLSEKTLLKPEEVSKTNFSLTIEDKVERYIQDNFEKSTIEDYGSYVYELIQDKAYDFASELVEGAKEEYIIENEEEIINAILSEIGFNSLYQLADNLLEDAPVTLYDHLSEVGMSIKDFI